MNVRVQAAPPQPPAPEPSAGAQSRAGHAPDGRGVKHNPRVSPTLELTLPDDLWADAETRDLLESLAQNM